MAGGSTSMSQCCIDDVGMNGSNCLRILAREQHYIPLDGELGGVYRVAEVEGVAGLAMRTSRPH